MIGFEWSQFIDEYANQYNSGAHQSIGKLSPFEVFFGRKLNKPSTKYEFVDLETTEASEDDKHDHLVKANTLRSKAEKSSKKESEKMVLRGKRKFPPSVYATGEQVIIKNVYLGKKIKSKAEKTFFGTVLQNDGDRYKIKYLKNGKEVTEWLPVSLVTSTTRSSENNKQAESRQKQKRSFKAKQKQKRSFKSKYHLQKNTTISGESIGSNKTEVFKMYNLRKKESSNEINISGNVLYTKEKINIVDGKEIKQPLYNLRQKRVSSYKERTKQYKEDLEEAIKISKRQKPVNLTHLNNVLSQRGLRSVETAGDGNCFFRAIAFELLGSSERYSEVRARAVQQVIDNPHNYQEFLPERNIDSFILELSTDREWADNIAIQAVSDAFNVCIELINSNERYQTSVINPISSTSQRTLILGHIDQLHFMATEPDLPFETATWGGFVGGEILKDTCPLDGPLSWLTLAIAIFPKLKSIIEVMKLNAILDVYEFFRVGESDEGKKYWFEKISGKKLKNGNFYGSESQQFFEPLSNTELARLEYQQSCKKCPTKLKRKTYPIFNNNEHFYNVAMNQNCSACGGLTTLSLEKPPPFLFVPKDLLNNDEIPTIIDFSGIVYVLLLLTIYIKSKDHFAAYFRFNNNYWICYDGLESNREKTFIMPSITLESIRHLLYCQLDLLNINNPFFEENITLSDHGSVKRK